MQPTIKDVAKVAGVHFATVSLALRDDPRITAATKRRVRSAALQIGYCPNPAFRALSARRTTRRGAAYVPSIAYLTNRSEANGLYATAHHRLMVAGARAQTEAMGYRFELLSLDTGAHSDASLQACLEAQKTEGLILGALEPGRAEPSLDWEQLSAVRIDSLHLRPSLPSVAPDLWDAIRTTFARLRDRGCRRIGLAVGVQDEEDSDDMHRSALLCEHQSLPPTARIPLLLFPHAADSATALPMLAAWIQTHRPDAIVSNWINVRSMIETLGHRCPDDIACACLCLDAPNPHLSGIVSNHALIGARAASLAAERVRSGLRGVPTQATRTYVQGQWHEGSSSPSRA